MDRQLLDTAALAGHLIPENSMFAFLAFRRAEVFPDADSADLFAPPGWACRQSGLGRWPRFWSCRSCAIIPSGRPPRRSGSTCGGRWRPARRWMIRGSIGDSHKTSNCSASPARRLVIETTFTL